MNKEFIPYEQALELKELGFNEECAAHYLDVNDLELKWKIYRNLSFNTSKCLQAPLYQQAFRWFRENHDFFSFIEFIGEDRTFEVKIDTDDEYLVFHSNTYEEGELTCLKKLIEIFKNK
jgi:hypothetical protein